MSTPTDPPQFQLKRLVGYMQTLGGDRLPGDLVMPQTKDILTLCDAIESAVPVIELLQKRLESGAILERHKNGKWRLREENGKVICGGANIRGILMNLIWLEC